MIRVLIKNAKDRASRAEVGETKYDVDDVGQACRFNWRLVHYQCMPMNYA